MLCALWCYRKLIEEGGQFTGYWLICGGCLLEQDVAHRKLMEVIEKFKLGVGNG